MNDAEALRARFDKAQRRALIVGLVAALPLVAGAFFSTRQFFEAYLYGYTIWLGLSLGSLGILILHHLVSGHWGNLIQRIVESGARLLVLMALLFLPIVLGMHHLYPWTDHAYVEASHVLHQKSGYLNIPFFLARATLYFLMWIGMAFWLSKTSRLQDSSADVTLVRKMKIFSGPSLVLFVLTVTFASVDWLMSLEPEWYSVIFGMQTIVGAVLTTLAFAIVVVRLLADREPISGVITTRHIHHLGNLLMAFTILWAYMAFSQFLIIWSGNLPEDNMYYLRRLGTGWNVVALILLIGHFFVPLLVLLSRRVKRAIHSLALIAAGIFVMRFVDWFWLIMPAFSHEAFRFHWLDLVAPVAIGGIWVAAFIWQVKGQPLVPLHDPRFYDDGGGH